MWTTEIIICLVADHAWTMEIVQEKRQYIKKNNKIYLGPRYLEFKLFKKFFKKKPLNAGPMNA